MSQPSMNYGGSLAPLDATSFFFLYIYRINITQTVSIIIRKFSEQLSRDSNLSRDFNNTALPSTKSLTTSRKHLAKSSWPFWFTTYSPGINYRVTDKLCTSKIHTILKQSSDVSASILLNIL